MWIGEYEWSIEGITVDTMLGSIEDFYEYSSLVKTEWCPEGVEDGPLHGLKDNIKYGDKLWPKLCSSYSIFDVINEDNSDGNSDDFPIEKTDAVSLGLFESSMLHLDDSYKLVEELGCK